MITLSLLFLLKIFSKQACKVYERLFGARGLFAARPES